MQPALTPRALQGTLGLPHEGLATASKAALEAAAAAGSGGIGEDGTGQRARRKGHGAGGIGDDGTGQCARRK
eukprot:808457-Pelagomonas_calceolata.AAC.2